MIIQDDNLCSVPRINDFSKVETVSEVYIISALRTPIGVGKPQGALASFLPVELAAMLIRELIQRSAIDPGWIEDIILGCVTPIGDQGANIARLAALHAGLPVSVPAVSINRMCGSSQQAVHFAAQAILAGDMDLVIAGGIEMMSHQPLGADYPTEWPSGFPYRLDHQGVSAEMMAEKWLLTREELDDYGFQSHLRAMSAIKSTRFAKQIVKIQLPNGREVSQDEGVCIPPDREKLRSLPPVFKSNGVITAGNSSHASDGAAALLIASPQAVGRYNLVPRARIVERVAIGSDPVLMLDAPIPATRMALQRAGLELEQMDVIEINETFASVVLAWAKEYAIHDFSRVNPNGGAIAHGHPLGATGAVLMTKLLYELERSGGRFGLQTMSIGHGMATATILERI
jgi:acetyl-CoA acyltransferase